MSIQDTISNKGIEEALHFTTHLGLTGILHTSKLMSRFRLSRDKRLEFILRLNTPRVLDHGWEDYVNLSISRVNYNLFGISYTWHPDVNWRILAFDPIILTHTNVIFCTTNNAYHQHVVRGQGEEGLLKLFNPEVPGRYGRITRRQVHTPDSHTTCPQAEVLYPGELHTGYLKKIYVKAPEDYDDVHGQLAIFPHRNVQVIIDPTKFEEGTAWTQGTG